MKTTVLLDRNSNRMFNRQAFLFAAMLCLLLLLTPPMWAQKQTVPMTYSFSFLAEQNGQKVYIQQESNLTARRMITRVFRANQQFNQFEYSYSKQGATLLATVQSQPVLLVEFPASLNEAAKVTWLNGATADTLHAVLFPDVQFLNQMREEKLSGIGLPVEAAYLIAFKNTDAFAVQSSTQIIRHSTNEAVAPLVADPLTQFCAEFGGEIFSICVANHPSDPENCGLAAAYAYADCILTLGY